MTTLDKASKQWAARPSDERFDSVAALRDHAYDCYRRSRGALVNVNEMRAEADGEDIVIAGKGGASAKPTHWAFGQLTRRIGAPAEYLRSLPAPVAAQCVNAGLAQVERSSTASDQGDTRLLLRAEGSSGLSLRAMTSDKYVRIWNHEVAQSLLDLQERQPSWTFPTSFKRAGGGSVADAWGESKELPVAFASDHDMFVFLVDYERGVKVDGQDHPLARGFFVENSEVGASRLVVTTFLFDFVCSNVLVWGASNVREMSTVHIGNARDRFFSGDVAQAMRAFGQTSAHEDEERIRRMRRSLIADTQAEVVDFVTKKTKLGQRIVSDAYEAIVNEPRYGDPRSLWGMVNGLTEVSQRTPHMDTRIAIDRSAGKLLDMVA